MRKTVFFAFALAACSAGFAQTPSMQNAPVAPKSLTQPILADGTPVKLRAGASINTAAVRLGESLQLDVIEEVRVNDVVVIPTTSSATAIVTSENVMAGAAHDGKINVSLRYVTLADGQKITLRPTRQKKASASIMSEDGQDIALTNGLELTGYIDGTLPIDLPKMRLANQPMGDLKITSTPTNADVTIDGAVVGTTPFAGKVVRGDHIVTLRVVGFQTWLHTVRITAEPANLQIALTKQDGLESAPPQKIAPLSLGDAARAARAKKGVQDPQKSSEPIELINNDPGTKPPAPQN